MDEEEAGTTPLRVATEYVDPPLEVDNDSVLDLILNCVWQLHRYGADPETTRLVITGDLVASVVDRSANAEGEASEPYSLDRGIGTVEARTMRLQDNTIDVLMPSHRFAPPDMNGFDYSWIAVRTAIHEAQHVAMMQAGEAMESEPEGPWCRRRFLAFARVVLEEYRAEAVVSRAVEPRLGVVDDLAEASHHWLAELQRLTTIDYQGHLDVARLARDVFATSLTFWKLLGYAVAELDASSVALPDELERSLVWHVAVSEYWEDFAAIVRATPDAQQRAGDESLHGRAGALADLLDRWLTDLGIEARDGAAGEEATFRIVDWTALTFDIG